MTHMEETSHKHITATYSIFLASSGDSCLPADSQTGRLVESTPEDSPLQIVTGFNMTPLPALEKHLATLAAGDRYELTLAPEDAFGERSDDRLMVLDRELFCIDGEFDTSRVYPGACLPMRNQEGHVFYGTVKEIDDVMVKMDFNHPLAGETLKINGIVIDSHPATEEEIDALTAHHCCHHGEGGCHHGEGGCHHGEGGCHHGEGGCHHCDTCEADGEN